jgi:hypothetical protein
MSVIVHGNNSCPMDRIPIKVQPIKNQLIGLLNANIIGSNIFSLDKVISSIITLISLNLKSNIM